MIQPPQRSAPPAVVMTTPYDLNLRHLRGLLAVEEHGSISTAAQAISLSQPALTQGILKLENQLGEVLFDRRSDGMVPTTAGKLVLDRARACMGHLTTGGRLVTHASFEPDRRLTMTQLRAFLGLFQSGSYAAASHGLGLSQTAVHRGVRELEETLGRKLVERRGRGVYFNFAGRRFARSCRLAVGELQAALLELGLDPNNLTIAVGTTPLARAFLVPEAMARMVAQRHSGGFRISEGSWGELVEALRDGHIDMIVGELPKDAIPDLAIAPLYDEAPVIVAGSQHRLVGKTAPSLKTLASFPWIIAPESSPLRAQWEHLFSLTRPQAPIECESIMIIGRLLTSSDMLTLAMPDQVALQIRSGLLARVGGPLADSMTTIGVTMRNGWKPTQALGRFIDTLRGIGTELNAQSGRNSIIEPRWV